MPALQFVGNAGHPRKGVLKRAAPAASWGPACEEDLARIRRGIPRPNSRIARRSGRAPGWAGASAKPWRALTARRPHAHYPARATNAREGDL